MDTLLRNTPLLAISQALMVSTISLIVTCSAIVGFELAADKSLATLPAAVMFITTMLGSIPAAFLLEKIGRKKGFMLATLLGVTASAVCTQAIISHQFWWFVFGIALFGFFNSVGNYFRFAAADNVDTEYKSRAISYVMLGGVFAAFIGPNLANYAKYWIDDAVFAGSFAATTVIYILMLISLSFLSLDLPTQTNKKDSPPPKPRPLRVIAKQPKFIVAIICAMLGYGVMSLVMTATPLSMLQHQHTFPDTAFVIQWHLLGMFVPSFFTGYLIRYFGITPILIAGVLIGFFCVAINLSGHGLSHYWSALVLLGICWNFLFIGGTTLLTETYRQEERSKAQAINDFIVFSTAAAASLSAGFLQYNFGWKMVNLGVIPALLIVLISLIWLKTRPFIDTVAAR